MVINIYFGPVFSDFAGQHRIRLELKDHERTVRDLMTILYDMFPNFKKELSERNMLNCDMPNAIFVLDGQLVNLDAILSDGAEIKILILLSGG